MVRSNEKVSRMPERRANREIPVRGGGLSSLRGEMNRLFDRFHGRTTAPTGGRRSGDLAATDPFGFGRDPFEMLESALTEGGLESLGRADLSETEDAYELQVDLPGMKKDDVEVDYADGVVTISGERRDDREEERKGYYLCERSYGAYRRNFRVPESVDHDSISARFSDGVLTVKLPKTEESRETSRKIDIKSED